MPLIDIIPLRNTQTCSINDDGTISFPQLVLQRLDWQIPSEIAVTYIGEPLTLLLRRANSAHAGFTLSYQNRPITSRTGGKITCSRFATKVLRLRLDLPLQGLMPIYLSGSKYQIALILEQPNWICEPFSLAGLKNIPSDVKGVYQLLGAADTVLRIGEGAIYARVREHLKDERFSSVRMVQYFSLTDKDETEIWERILISQYELANGELPPINRIRA